MQEESFQPESLPEDLKTKVNRAFEELGVGTRYKKVKETVPGCENLRGKRIVMVDDVKAVLETFVEDLVVASDGNASFILHKDQSLDELVGEIIQRNPDIVLVDGHLAHGIEGDAVIESLSRINAVLKSIIFSSDSHIGDRLTSGNIAGVVKKETSDPETSVKKVADIISSTFVGEK